MIYLYKNIYYKEKNYAIMEDKSQDLQVAFWRLRTAGGVVLAWVWMSDS